MGGCEPRIEVIVKMQWIKFERGVLGGGGGPVSGCEPVAERGWGLVGVGLGGRGWQV